MMKMRSPGTMVGFFAYGCAAIAALIILVALRMPALGVSFAPDGPGFIAATANGVKLARLRRTDQVTFESQAGKTSEKAEQLTPDFSPTGSAAEIGAWYARRDLLVRVASASPVTLGVRVGNQLVEVVLHPHQRKLTDLSVDVWLLLGQGCVIGLLGIWIAITRPRDWGARIFAVACLGILFAAFSGALYDAREVTADGTLLRLMLGFNFIGSDISSAAIVALFLCQPMPLFRPRVGIALICAAASAGLVSALGWLPLAFFYEGLVLLSVAFFGVLVLQWNHSRADPLARATVRWVGVTTFLGTSILVTAMAAPKLFGVPSFGGNGMSFLPLFVVYGGIAFGVGRYRLFDLDRWSYQVVLGAMGALALLAADTLLIGGLGVAGPVALAISVLFIGYLYFPVRLLLWRWIVGPSPLTDSELFQVAAEVAFAADASDRRRNWRALMNRLFDPLEMAPLAEIFEAPCIRGDGVELVIPAAADEVALLLRHRSKGRRLFGRAQVTLARELVDLMRRAERTRDEYTRGVIEERQRIARDLHDDVSARLLTSLHRDDVSLVRSDVRKAMSDIRTIVSSMTGEQVALDQVMADLRYETAERLSTANIHLDWPLPATAYDVQLLDYRIYKNLISSHREIVSNILQHSKAGHVVVTVEVTEARLRIVVEDDGDGVSLDVGRGRVGNGLRNISHRLDQIEGLCVLGPSERGTRVDIIIPLNPGNRGVRLGAGQLA